jgi:hypothetical protein
MVNSRLDAEMLNEFPLEEIRKSSKTGMTGFDAKAEDTLLSFSKKLPEDTLNFMDQNNFAFEFKVLLSNEK